MKVAMLLCLVVIIACQGAYAAVTASESDFNIDCGTEVGGPVTVEYTNPDPGGNPVAKISSPGNKASCVATGTGGVFTISDVRSNCIIDQPNSNSPEYVMQVVVQEYDLVYQKSDPVFVFKCSYVAGSVNLTTFIPDGGVLGDQTVVDVTATGDPDMVYSLRVVDSGNNPITQAAFGDTVFLQVTMDATDDDEQGVQVKSCNAKSGTVSFPIIEDFCVPVNYRSLFQLYGFASQGLQATFPVKLFALEGTDSRRVEFECVVNICPTACPGTNCASPPVGKRKRRAASDESAADKTVKMATSVEILAIRIPNSGTDGQQNGQQGSVSASTCVKSLGFIVTVVVLAVLLLVAMVAVVYMLTTRRRELQKQGT